MNCVAFDWIEYGVSGYTVFAIPLWFAFVLYLIYRFLPDERVKKKQMIRVPVIILTIVSLLFSYGAFNHYAIKKRYTAGDYEVYTGEVEYIGFYERNRDMIQVTGRKFILHDSLVEQGLTSISDLQCRVEPGMQVRIFHIGGRKIVRIEVLPVE